MSRYDNVLCLKDLLQFFGHFLVVLIPGHGLDHRMAILLAVGRYVVVILFLDVPHQISKSNRIGLELGSYKQADILYTGN